MLVSVSLSCSKILLRVSITRGRASRLGNVPLGHVLSTIERRKAGLLHAPCNEWFLVSYFFLGICYDAFPQSDISRRFTILATLVKL